MGGILKSACVFLAEAAHNSSSEAASVLLLSHGACLLQSSQGWSRFAAAPALRSHVAGKRCLLREVQVQVGSQGEPRRRAYLAAAFKHSNTPRDTVWPRCRHEKTCSMQGLQEAEKERAQDEHVKAPPAPPPSFLKVSLNLNPGGVFFFIFQFRSFFFF